MRCDVAQRCQIGRLPHPVDGTDTHLDRPEFLFGVENVDFTGLTQHNRNAQAFAFQLMIAPVEHLGGGLVGKQNPAIFAHNNHTVHRVVQHLPHYLQAVAHVVGNSPQSKGV